MSLRVCIAPNASQVEDDNGVGRVIKAQFRYLPELGIELVDPEHADVIAAHITADGLPRVDALHLHGIYFTGDPDSGKYSRWHHDANRRILDAARKARAITVPSDWVAGPFLRDMRITPTVIGHGIEVDEWEPAEHKGYVLWNKNRAGDVCDPTPAAELARRGVDVVTTFAPDGVSLPKLRILGTQPHDKMKLLVRHAEVYLATTKETFGIGTLEALAAGVPVLGFDWGGTADLVDHQLTGYLVQPGDYDGLMEGLEYIRAHRARLSEAARATARLYDWRQVAARYAELYRRLAEPEPSGVSVVITNHNYGRFLAEAVDSVIHQADEIIIVDDGSTDESERIWELYGAHDHVKVILQDNRGVAAARNRGIAAAAHPLIVCLDADDRLSAGYVSLLKSAFDDRGLGIAYTGLSLLHPDGSLSPNTWPPEFSWESQATPHNPPSNCIPSAAMFRKTMWERAGGYKQVYAPGEDAEFWTRGLSLGFTAKKVTGEGLFEYRVGHQSASRTKQYRPIDIWHPWMRDGQYPMAAPAKVQPLVRSYSEPAISVVIPVGPGHAKYLPAALDSLLGQTFRNWEAIVVVDGYDELRPVLDQVRGPYPFIRMESHPKREGVAAARNSGLVMARAPLVLFLDADDYLMPMALDAMLRAHIANDGRYIYSDWIAVNVDQQEVRQVPDWTRDGWLLNGQHAVTALIPTAWARDVRGFDETLGGWEDWDFFIKLTVAGYCGHRVPEPLLAYRQHTGQRRAESFDRQAATKEILAERYGDYRTGVKSMPGCCGGNGDALLKVKAALGESDAVQALTLAADLPEGVARMEFVGEQVGAITFFGGGGRQYRGGNNAHDRYANVDPADVEKLLNTGKWRLVVRPKPAPAPTPIEDITAPAAPVAVEPEPLVPAGFEDEDDAAAVEAANKAAQEHTARRRGSRK